MSVSSPESVRSRPHAHAQTRFSRIAARECPDSSPIVARAVADAQAGSRDAVRFLYTRYAKDVYAHAFSVVRSHEDADDVTQHVFLKLIDNLDRYRATDVPFAAWLTRMTRNAAIDVLRGRREVLRAEVRAQGHAADGVGRLRGQDLRIALRRLPAAQREVVVLRHLVGLSPSEIGERMDRTEASVSGLHQRGRSALVRELTRIGAGPMRLARAPQVTG